jgi:anti-sigma B factor antagonist
VPASHFPIAMVTGVPVVAAPGEIDVSNADWLRAALLAAASQGQGTFVVDMTRTTFCNSAGLGVLVRAHKRAVAEGSELRLVLPASASALRVFTLTGIDRLIPSFTSLDQALAPAPAAAAPAPARAARRRRRKRRTRPPMPTSTERMPPEPGAQPSSA